MRKQSILSLLLVSEAPNFNRMTDRARYM